MGKVFDKDRPVNSIVTCYTRSFKFTFRLLNICIYVF